MITGQCLCGGVQYQISGELPARDGNMLLPSYCHCKMCQRVTGSAFWVATMVPDSQFSLEAGQNLLTRYESSPGVFRSFCKVCGSSLFFEATAEPNQLYIGLGSMDNFNIKPQSHIFVADKASWYDINDNLPQFDQYPT